jgi:hypothetical protein
VTAVLAPPVGPVRPEPFNPPSLPPPEPTSAGPARPGWRSALAEKWPAVLAIVAFGVYVAAGCYMLYSVHYAIGDALSRSEDARAVLFSRDPHLAAWGFVWFPGPVVLELPFMLVVGPLNHAALAGPLSTAMCGAITVLVMVKVFRRLGLSEPMVAGLTVAYCLNPVIIFYCANGMSEASFYLAASVFFLGLIRWYQEGGPVSLILMSLALAAAMTIREEALVLVPLASVVVAFHEQGWARRAKVAVLVALPGLFVFALWTFANWIIMGNPLFWYQGLALESKPPANAWWLPAHKTLISGILYAARYTWAFVPALFIVLPVLLIVVAGRRRKFWQLAAIVLPAAVFPSQVAFLISKDSTWGDPRYFASLTIFSIVVLGFAAREVATSRRFGVRGRRALSVLLVCLGGFNAVNGTLNDINPKTSHVESESIAFRAALGLSRPSNSYQPAIVSWELFDSYLDTYLAKGQLIIVDTGTAFPGPLFSRYPRQWVIPSDQDFQRVADNFNGQAQWLLSLPSAITFSSTIEIDQALASTDGGHFEKWKTFTVGDLYRWVPSKGG